MLSYQLGLLDVIKTLPAVTWFVFGLFIILGIFFFYTKPTRSAWLPVTAGAVIFIAVTAVMVYDLMGNGWLLKQDTLELKAANAHTSIELASTEMIYTDLSSGPWRPVLRTNAYGTPELYAGEFVLANGQKALVFSHRMPPKMMVLKSHGSAYIIAHPGVAGLYRELSNRGVKEIAVASRN